MVTATHRRLALELRMAVETLVAQPSPDAYNQLSKMLAALCRAGMTGTALDAATSTMSDICDRYERVNKIGIKAAEAQALRQAIGAIDGAIARIPVNVFMEAVASIDVYCAALDA